MHFLLPGSPIAKQRHRSGRTKTGIRSFDPQSEEKNHDKWRCIKQMRENGLKMLATGKTHLTLSAGIPYPKKTPQKRKKGQFVTARPDLDNFVKYYCDVMNGIVYPDDSQICSLYAEKRYTNDPCTEIYVVLLEEYAIKEYVATTKTKFNEKEIEYITMKANSMGKEGRNITGVSTENTPEGVKLYFETSPEAQQQAR